MHYNPKYHHRRSIRLKGYDYAQAGLYFITVCCDRRHNPGWTPFGNIEKGVLHLNNAGRMVEKWYYELENKYPDKRCHEMVVMPMLMVVKWVVKQVVKKVVNQKELLNLQQENGLGHIFAILRL